MYCVREELFPCLARCNDTELRLWANELQAGTDTGFKDAGYRFPALENGGLHLQSGDKRMLRVACHEEAVVLA